MQAESLTGPLVLAGAPENHVDLLYVTGFMAPDPIVYVEHGRNRRMMVSGLEYGRAVGACAERGIEVLTPQHVGLQGADRNKLDVWIRALLDPKHDKRIRVPASFPSGWLRKLEQAGIRVDVLDRDPFPARRKKRAAELAHIRSSQQAAVIAMRAAIGMLSESRIGRDSCLYAGRDVLTAGMVRQRIAEVLLRHDCVGGGTIVACGRQGADPHEHGSGPLQAHQPIVIDIFPRNQTNGYWGDLTRTVVKGSAPAEIKQMYLAVKAAHGAALRQVRPGVPTRRAHEAAAAVLDKRGFTTGRDETGFYGFIHSTGHGVGLAVHEEPSVGRGRKSFCVGDVVTIEPGLYYPRIGGLRIEDTVTVTPSGWRYLVPCEKRLEIL